MRSTTLAENGVNTRPVTIIGTKTMPVANG